MRGGPLLVAVALLLAARGARAQDQPSPGRSDETGHGRSEIDAIPIAGGDSDIGFGGGFVGAITKFAPGDEHRWDWRLVASAFLTFRASPSFGVPYQDHWLQIIVPSLLDGRLRFEARAAFTKENDVQYYGLGNAVPTPPTPGSRLYVYARTHPMLEAYARTSIAPHVYAIAGTTFTVNLLDVPEGTRLADDMLSGSPEVRSLLGSANDHAVAIVQESVGYDTRDDEVVPHRGTWNQIDLRLSPALGSFVPYSYGEVLGIARVYQPVGSRVVLAARGLVDLLFGNPPFFQLAEYEDTYAIGGTAGVRGVPAQRYYGKIKLLGNLEGRVDVVRFHLVDKPWELGLVGFFDAGRLWADWRSLPQLDGTGLGLKWGTGVGVRVQQGSAFVVRGDIAWSPDALPIAGYFAVGETF
jgi:hypothetical protein